MGNVTVSLEARTEARLRQIANEKYGGKKGSLARVITESLEAFSGENTRLRAKERLLKRMETGFDFGKKLYKTRYELYDR